MKIEVGKYYRTRGGDRVKIISEDNGCIYQYDGCNHLSYTSSGTEFTFGESENDLISEWTDTPEVGTLEEIGARAGDVVGNIDFENVVHYVQAPNDPYGRRVLWASTEKVHTKGILWNSRESGWRIISRANQGPVREVTTVRKEIVPGVYGKVEVWEDCSEGGMAVDVKPIRIYRAGMAELTAAIDTLTAIRDAMPA